MLTTPFSRCIAFSVFSLLATGSSLAVADGGSIRFHGSIVEPVCNVQPQIVSFDTLSANKGGSKIPLSFRCHADQSVQISMQDMGRTSKEKTFSSGVAGAEIAISHKTKLMSPGDKISYTFAGKKDVVVPLTATLRKAANMDTKQMHSGVLVSINYL